MKTSLLCATIAAAVGQGSRLPGRRTEMQSPSSLAVLHSLAGPQLKPQHSRAISRLIPAAPLYPPSISWSLIMFRVLAR
jgi:hypothetical protein